METELYYSICYNGDQRTSDYQITLPKSITTSGDLIPPENALLFGLLYGLLMKGKQNSNIGNPLFDQAACLEYHYQNCKAPKQDFLNYTKMMYLSHTDGKELTRVQQVIDKRVMDWFNEKEKEIKKPPLFRTYLMGEPDWGEILWEYNTGKKYQHKQDLVAVFWNSFVYIEQKFEGYFERYKIIDYDTLHDLTYKFRQKFPLKNRVEGINYYDDLINQMIIKFESKQKGSKETHMTISEKLNKILKFVMENKSRYNIALATVHKDIFHETLPIEETRQLFKRVIESGSVKVLKDRYIGWSIDTEAFINNGGFGETHPEANKTPSKITPDVFFSYCWENKEIAEKIFTDLKATGLNCRKDNHELEYKDSISHFMESIRESDYAILLLSDEYLKSKNCMIELSHLMKDRNHKQKILPLIVPGTKIFKSEDRLVFTNHWKTEHSNLKEHLKTLDVEDVLEEGKHLKAIRDIAQNISEYLNSLSDMLVTNLEDLQQLYYKPLVEKIVSYRKN